MEKNRRRFHWTKGLLFALLLCFFFMPVCVYGADFSLEDYDFSALEKQLEQIDNGTVSFREIVEKLKKGEIAKALNLIGKGMVQQVVQELNQNRKILIQLIGVSIFATVFTNFSNAFSSQNVGEAGFYVTYLVLFTILISSYRIAASVTVKAVEDLLNFMKVLIPAFCISITTASGMASSVGVYGGLMLGVMLADYIVLRIVLPLANLQMILQLVDNLDKEGHFSKMAELIAKGIDWLLKSIVAGVAGVQVLQGLLLPTIDSVKGNAIRRGISLIPGAGQASAAVLSTMIGTGVVIKNSIGAAGLLCILFVISIPVVKLSVIMVGYQVIAAVLQPVSDKRLTECIFSVGQCAKILLRIIWLVAALFMISIALIAATTNVTYFGS